MLDIDYLLWLQGIRETLGGTNFFCALTTLAMPVAVGSALVLYWFFNKRLGLWSLMAFAIGNVVLQLLKATCCVLRPWVRDPRIKPPAAAISGATGYSFPSGHTQTTASALGAAVWDTWRTKRGASIGIALFILLVGFSRNYLGVHTPQDVVVGLVVGALSVWMAGRALSAVESDRMHDTTLLVALLALSALGTIYIQLKPYPTDASLPELAQCAEQMVSDSSKSLGSVAGLALGWFLERRYVAFSCDCPRAQKLIRLAAILACLVLVLAAVLPAIKLACSGGVAYKWLQGFLLMLAAIWGGPALGEVIYARFLAPR